MGGHINFLEEAAILNRFECMEDGQVKHLKGMEGVKSSISRVHGGRVNHRRVWGVY